MQSFFLQECHPLSRAHVLVRKTKADLPTLTGPPPLDRSNTRSMISFAAYQASLHKP